jgi:microcystin degradation protein MlrC
MMLEDLKSGLPVDGIFLDLHGAMVTEHLDDGEGELLARIRKLVGPKVPIIAELDFHANISERMVAESDALIGYRTYPHVDMAEIGRRAARHLHALISGALPQQAKAHRKLDFLVPGDAQCTLIEPARALYRRVSETDGRLIGNGRVSTASLLMGFPSADIPDNGPSVVVYADTQAAADQAADELASALAAAEASFRIRRLSAVEGVELAIQRSKRGGPPVVLADTQDNPGGGGPGDTVGLLRALIDLDAQEAVLGLLTDEGAARKAHGLGVGATAHFSLGAKLGGADENPVEGEFTVEALHDGHIVGEGPMRKGIPAHLGPMALLRYKGVRVGVASIPDQCSDQSMLKCLGIDPKSQRILALKSSVHFRADFEPIAQEVHVIESPGPVGRDHTKMPFKRLRPGVRLMPMGPAFQP